MTVTKIAVIRGSIMLIAAAILAACGGDGSGGSLSVPNVVGDTQAAAGMAISGAGLTLGTVTQASSATLRRTTRTVEPTRWRTMGYARSLIPKATCTTVRLLRTATRWF
jgi:hypothetical protein